MNLLSIYLYFELLHRLDLQISLIFSWNSPKLHNIEKRNVASKDTSKIVGFRVERSEKEVETEDGVPVIRSGTKVLLRLFGLAFTETTVVGLTSERLEIGKTCNMMISTGFFKIDLESSTNALVEILLPKSSIELYFCMSNEGDVSLYFIQFHILNFNWNSYYVVNDLFTEIIKFFLCWNFFS